MTPEQIEQERSEFEAWYLGSLTGRHLDRNADGHYLYMPAQIAWNVWRVRASRQWAWHDVSEKPPFDEIMYLVWDKEKGRVRLAFYGAPDGWKCRNVSHWMRVPAPLVFEEADAAVSAGEAA